MLSTRASFFAGVKDVSPIIPGIIPFGLVTGAAVIEGGHGLLEALGMSLLVNAGAAQLAATVLANEGAPLLIALGTGLVINTRMLIYATSLAPVIMPEAKRGKVLLGHPLVDQAYASTMTIGRYRTDTRIVPYYVGSWAVLASIWQLSNIAGALGGTFVPDGWSLDFAIPLVFLAMLVPALRERADYEAAVVAGVAGAILVPVLPMQTGMLVAIVAGMVWGALRHGKAATVADAGESAEAVDSGAQPAADPERGERP